MLRRKSSRPFLICSLIIHILVTLIMIQVEFELRRMPQLDDSLQLDITHLPRPEIRPRKQFKPTPPPAPAKPVKAVKEVSILKPKPAPASDWLAIDISEANQRTAIMTKMNASSTPERIRRIHQPQLSTTERPNSTAITITTKVNLQQSDSREVLPPTTHENISVAETEDNLTANSPDVRMAKLHFGRRRGEALGGMPIGNTSGGGSASGTSAGTNYIQMMTDLARNLTAVAITRKIDLVFIIDKTGSMEDNVRGIRAYIDLFFEHLIRAGHDTAVGLVTFADAVQDKPKVRNITTNHSKFKNWLYKIKFEGGGDLAESGLDALMAALHQTQFRPGAQRFFVLASDGVFHDADYDGRSEYSLDQAIERLQHEGIRVDIIGLDFLPIKQIAWATSGTWRVIPGKGYLEHIPPTLTAKMLSELGTLGFSENTPEADELMVYISRHPRPMWLKIMWKVLNPLGERCYGPFTEHLNIPNDDSEMMRFTPTIDVSQFLSMSGTYTIIYRLENNLGHRSILRRALERTD